MIKKVFIGIIAGALIGMFVTSIIISNTNDFKELFLTKITATSIITGFFCGIYAKLSKSKWQVFYVSIFIGLIIFYIKYLITGHDFDSLTMGAFVGAMLGGFFAIIKKNSYSIKVYTKLRKRRKNSFGNYS